NCLYLQMRIHGHPVDYDQVVQHVDVGPRGNDLAELHRAASELGFPTAIIQCAPDDLTGCPLPVIAHLDHPETERGHFVLVTACQEARVGVIDGTTALGMDIPMDRFRRQWSGYLLVPASATLAWLPWVVSLVSGAAVLAGFWWWRVRRVYAQEIVSLASGALVIAGMPGAGRAQTDIPQDLRQELTVNARLFHPITARW